MSAFKYAVLAIIAVLLPLSCQALEVGALKSKNCEKYNYTVCNCGVDSGKVAVAMEMCQWKDPLTSTKQCEPCNNHLFRDDICKKFENCLTCLTGLKKCLTCPYGKHGPFCEKDRLERLALGLDLEGGQFNAFPIHLRIPRGAPIRENRIIRAIDSCEYPANMDTSELDCKIWPHKIVCKQICVYGYTLPEGITKELTCKFEENRWLPSAFEECKPFVDCSLKLTSSGDIYCVTNKMTSGPMCDLSCNEYEDLPPVPVKKHECNLDGSWSPPLPFCMEPAKETLTVPAPAVKTHSR